MVPLQGCHTWQRFFHLTLIFAVNQALGNKLFKKVYDISRVSEIEDETESAKARSNTRVVKCKYARSERDGKPS